jgi:hypothetical protein
LVAIIDKKINQAAQEGKTIEKAYFNEGANGQSGCKDFIKEMINKRKEFHKY